MNILFINNMFVGFMVSDIPRVSVFGHCPYSVTFPCDLCRCNTRTFVHVKYGHYSPYKLINIYIKQFFFL